MTFSVPLTSRMLTRRGPSLQAGLHQPQTPLRCPALPQVRPEDTSNTAKKRALRTGRMRGAGSAPRGASSKGAGDRQTAWSRSPAGDLRTSLGPAYLGECLARPGRRSLCESAACDRK